MRFSLKKQNPPPPPNPPADQENGMETGLMTDDESSYGPMPPPPPPPPLLNSDIIAQKQSEYDEENAAKLEDKSPENMDPSPHDTTQDVTCDDDENTNEVATELNNLVGDKVDENNNKYDNDYEETEIPDDDDAESVEIPPTSVVQRMIAEESFRNEKTAATSTLFRAGTLLLCSLLLLAIILGVGFGTGAFTQDSDTGNGNKDRGNSTENNAEGQRPSDIQIYLASKSVVPDHIQATNTAESKAVSWLIAEDPLTLGIDSTADQFRLEQRYVLLTFYFGSTKKWINETGWLVQEDECEWHGVTCTETEVNNVTVNAVTELVLQSNAIDSTIPMDLIMLQSLSTLDLTDNDMVQDLSSFGWNQMLSMVVLRLYGNKFSGDIAMFAMLPPTIQVLSIGSNTFNGTIPDGLDALTALTELNIEANQLSGPISDVLNDLNVTILRIGDNNFDTAGFPVFIYTMTQLEELGLGATNINSNIEGALKNLESLRILEIYDNPMNGTIPTVVLAMSSIEEFIAYNCQFSGPFPNISGWIGMKTLLLSDNTFTGTIIDTLSTLSNLQTLQLDGNLLTGDLPLSITSLQSLEVLDLSKNPFSGTIPFFVGDLLNLRELRLNAFVNPDFEMGGLIGTIPTSVGSLSKLEVLELRGNFLDGPLPDTLGGLDAIQTFDVRFNQLSGQVPDVIGSWSDTVMFIQLSNNVFTGSIPATVCGTLLETMVADCNVNCTCCTSCVND